MPVKPKIAECNRLYPSGHERKAFPKSGPLSGHSQPTGPWPWRSIGTDSGVVTSYRLHDFVVGIFAVEYSDR
ncbi:hypothetical protein J6590_026315 [Homalodisca vitripennis]|nr:hypothetical protein J6590_026315 [Homalodisca vitripennis]